MAWKPDYITVEALRNFMRIDDTDDDVELAVAITAASRAIDKHCNRQFGKVAAAQERWYTARPDYETGRWVVDIDDLQDLTNLAVTVNGVALDDDYFVLEPVNAAEEGKPYTRLAVLRDAPVQPTGAPNEVAVTARWGWNAIPSSVVQASYLQSSRFHSRRNSPYGIAGSPDDGSEMRLLSRVDPDVAVSLGDVRRRRAVA